MPRASSADKNVSPFPPISKKQWTEAAKQELDGHDPIEKLKQRVDEIDVFPLYDSSDAPFTNFQLPVSQNEFLGPRTWLNLPRISVNDAKEANEVALQALNAGADGILFDLQDTVDLHILLKQIDLPYCGTAFLVGSGQAGLVEELSALVKARKYTTSGLSGAIFWKSSLPELKSIEKFNNWSQFHSLGIIAEQSTSASTGIASLLAQSVKQLDELPDSKEKINSWLNSFAFSVSVGSDFFLEIAKFKALRLLWQHVAGAYDSEYLDNLHIHAHLQPAVNPSFEPHGNMINTTTRAMSAILGGCNSLTVEPQDQESVMMARVARNISSILREESHLGKVADATVGSYYIEKLTDQLAAEAWQKFQQVMK